MHARGLVSDEQLHARRDLWRRANRDQPLPPGSPATSPGSPNAWRVSLKKEKLRRRRRQRSQLRRAFGSATGRAAAIATRLAAEAAAAEAALPSWLKLLIQRETRMTGLRRLLEGYDAVRIFGELHDVRCGVRHINGLSAHADRDDLLAHLEGNLKSCEQVFVVHGEEDATAQFATRLRRKSKRSGSR